MPIQSIFNMLKLVWCPTEFMLFSHKGGKIWTMVISG